MDTQFVVTNSSDVILATVDCGRVRRCSGSGNETEHIPTAALVVAPIDERAPGTFVHGDRVCA